MFVFVLALTFALAVGQNSTASISTWSSPNCPGNVASTQIVDANVCAQVLTSPPTYGNVNCNASIQRGVEDADDKEYSFVIDIFPLLQQHAFVGHSGFGSGAPYLMFTNDSTQVYATLTQNFAKGNPNMKYVTPFQPEQSYLYHKITNTQLQFNGTGGIMPPAGFPRLTEEVIDIFYDWILQGARFDAKPVQVISPPWQIRLFSDANCTIPLTNLTSINGTDETFCSNSNVTNSSISPMSFKVQCATGSVVPPKDNSTNNQFPNSTKEPISPTTGPNSNTGPAGPPGTTVEGQPNTGIIPTSESYIISVYLVLLAICLLS